MLSLSGSAKRLKEERTTLMGSHRRRKAHRLIRIRHAMADLSILRLLTSNGLVHQGSPACPNMGMNLTRDNFQRGEAGFGVQRFVSMG
jgi:hypothetical protein